MALATGNYSDTRPAHCPSRRQPSGLGVLSWMRIIALTPLQARTGECTIMIIMMMLLVNLES
jgi:hypothetical protein